MNSRISNILFCSLISLPIITVAQSTQKGSGIAVSESKSKACSVALGHAKTEAVQASGVHISVDTNINQKSENGQATSKLSIDIQEVVSSFIKVIAKDEKTSYNPSTGTITCMIEATFDINESEIRKELVPQNHKTPSLEVTGLWKTNWGDLKIKKYGKKIKGNYSEDNGVILG